MKADWDQRSSLPNLQSIVIVFLKLILSNVTALGNLASLQNGLLESLAFGENDGSNKRLPKNNLNLAKQMSNMVNADRSGDETANPALVELNATRLREITSKTIAGILLMLLKWFKLSRRCRLRILAR